MSIMNLSSSRMIQHSLPRRLLHNHSGVVSIALFFVFCCVVFSLITGNFLTGTNWLNIIRQSAPLLIVATAMTLVITTGGIDLSVGSTLALVGALSAIALNNWGLPWPVKIGIGALALAVFLAYMLIVGRRAQRLGENGDLTEFEAGTPTLVAG